MDFKKIDLSAKQIFDDYLLKYPVNISDVNFTNLFTWSKIRNHEYFEYDDHLIVTYLDKNMDETGKRIFYQPLGEVSCLIISKLLDEFPNSHFERVDKNVFARCGVHTIIDQEDMFDYVYDIDVLKKLSGKKFKSKRRFISEFETYNPEIIILSAENVGEFIAAQKKWFADNSKLNDGIKSENIAVLELLENISHFPKILGVGVKVDGELVGFAIGEPLNDDTFVEHFEKGDLEYSGVYQYILKVFCDHIPDKFVYLNREQDLGIEGLRKAKQSYEPLRMIEKIKITK